MTADSSLGAFEVPDLWRPSLLTTSEVGSSLLFTDFELDVHAIPIQNPYATKTTLDHELRLPSLDTFQYGAVEPTLVSEGSVTSTDVGYDKDDSEDPEDLWLSLAELPEVQQERFSWERFYGHDKDHVTCLSECRPLAFNAAIEHSIKHSAASLRQGPIAKTDIALKSLFDLALGRSSLLYSWDEKGKTFRSNYQDMTSTGLSSSAFSSITDVFLDCGCSIIRLRKFVEKTYSAGDIASKIALAHSISTIFSIIENAFTSSLSKLRTLLQLQLLSQRPAELLRNLLALLVNLRRTKTDEQVSSVVYVWCQKTALESSWLSVLARKILGRVSMPLLERTEQWIGLRRVNTAADTTSSRLAFITPSTAHNVSGSNDDFILDAHELPAYLSPTQGAVIAEIGSSLRVLQKHHPDHVLLRNYIPQPSVRLEWQQTWPDVDSLLQRAQKYEKDLCTAVRSYAEGQYSQLGLSSRQEKVVREEPDTTAVQDHKTFIESSIHILSARPSISYDVNDDLGASLHHQLQDTKPPIQEMSLFATPSIEMSAEMSFGPFLHAQARLVRGACMRTLFRSHELRKHFHLQRQFHLMGDGVFVARLSAALFDNSVASTERELGVMRSGNGMGLKLGHRSTWPPASSELRLALMGILSECFTATQPNSSSSNREPEIPGGLSFAVRNLSDDEVARVLQPQSLYALDFLRLQYQAISPLDSVITSTALDKYDIIFKFLLRLIRLIFVVSRLPTRGIHPSILLFCNKARNFVNATAQHFFNTAISKTWASFEKYLDNLVNALDEEDALNPPKMREIGGIDDLRRRHDQCLDDMLFGLLLRHRQQQIMAVLEEIYGYILTLESSCHADMPINLPQISKLHTDFVDKVVVFLHVCRGLGAKQSYGRDTGRENAMDQLVTVVDFNGYYASRTKRQHVA